MCTSPRSASFNHDGSINFSKKHGNPELVPFQLPCGKCVECMLERARDWSVRCTHEARMHSRNSFITLTYSDEHLPKDGRLNYTHFQRFMHDLRQKCGNGIGFFMCGEYGETTSRPHYHACLFGYDPRDKQIWSKNPNGDALWTSEELDSLWGLNDPEKCPNKIGAVTPKSAGYVARYVLKKQKDSPLKPFQKMSRQYAIGKRWIEKYWRDVFIHAQGAVILSDGTKTKVPRYYEKWFQKYHPEEWLCYMTETKLANTNRLKKKAEYEQSVYIQELSRRKGFAAHYLKSPLARKREILKHKQKQLKRNFL